MRAVLLAAGFGTRLKPITDHLPKCMVPIHGLPLLMWWVEQLLESGVHEILINLHWHPDFVRRAFADSPYRDQVQFTFEKELLGTGGTLLNNWNFCNTNELFVAHADNLSLFDVRAFVLAHQKRAKTCEITMMTFDAPDPKSCGIVELNKDGIVTAFHEKVANPPGRRANGAVYLFSSEVMRFIKSIGSAKVDLSLEVIPHFLGRIQSFQNVEFHRDIGTISAYSSAVREFKFPHTPKWIPEPKWWIRNLGENELNEIQHLLSLNRAE